MKIFFGISPRALDKYKSEYSKIYNLIEKLGHENLNDIPVKSNPLEFYKKNLDEVQDMYVDLTAKLKRADIVIIESTIHSLTMGFYIKMALDLDKPTIILHLPGSEPFFFAGIQNPRLQILEYEVNTLHEVLKHGIKYASENLDTRFNLFLSPELYNYLKWAAMRDQAQRATLIRNLLLKHKDEHLEEYLEDLKK